jgi:hypothetical protein
MFIDGEGVDFTPPSDSTGGLKTKERTEGSKVVVVDPSGNLHSKVIFYFILILKNKEVDAEEGEENKGNWWENSQMSGPKSRPSNYLFIFDLFIYFL